MKWLSLGAIDFPVKEELVVGDNSPDNSSDNSEAFIRSPVFTGFDDIPLALESPDVRVITRLDDVG